MNNSMNIPPKSCSIKPTQYPLGADVIGIDLKQALSKEEKECIENAWADHLVLRFRGQANLAPTDLTRFSSELGELDKRPVRGSINGGYNDLPVEINVISNIIGGDGKPIGGLGSYEADWHTDMSYIDIPPKGSCLYSVEIPPSGGNTSFINMYEAYNNLPEPIKSKISNLKCIHDASKNSTGELRQGFSEVIDPSKSIGAIHPLVRIHPVTKKQCLFLGRRKNAYIIGLPLDESEALLDELWTYATDPKLKWTQVWELGDAILWDNRCTMHQRDSFDPATRRLMYRTQIRGEVVLG
jgi:taurine dioxygenase